MLKVSSSISLCHISRLYPKSTKAIIEELTVKNLLHNLKDSTARIQQSLITLLNMFLIQNSNLAFNKLFPEKQQLLPILLKLLDKSSIVVRAKTLLTLTLLLRGSSKW